MNQDTLNSTQQALLIINAGSSSLKFSVFTSSLSEMNSRSPSQAERIQLVMRGQIEGIGVKPHFIVKDDAKNILNEKYWEQSSEINHEYLMKYLIQWLNENLKGAQVVAAGHRIVHGGSKYSKPILLSTETIDELEKLTPLAPLHQPHNLAAVKALKKVYPELKQIACFDTAFHRTNPEIFQHFFIPEDLEKEGVKKYGFHGLSYEYIAQFLKTNFVDLANKKVAVLHLGSGASACILNQGKSVSTSMGLTALDGLPMGTRPGQLDAGVVLYLMQEKKMSAKEIESLLYKKSGLLGLSGLSNDMRELEMSLHPRAQMTIEAFAWKIAQMVASLATLTQGLDAVVFTAGIGENSPRLRTEVCDKLKWLGVDLDLDLNNKNNLTISSSVSKVPVLVVPTNEELMIAQHVVEEIRT